MLRRIQQQLPGTAGQTPSLSDKCYWELLRALYNTQDQGLFVPSKGQSNNGFVVRGRILVFMTLEPPTLLIRNTRAWVWWSGLNLLRHDTHFSLHLLNSGIHSPLVIKNLLLSRTVWVYFEDLSFCEITYIFHCMNVVVLSVFSEIFVFNSPRFLSLDFPKVIISYHNNF